MARKIPENEEDFITMQQEAIRRVRDMQDRARTTLQNAGVPLERHEAPLTAEAPVNNSPRPAPSSPARDSHSPRHVTEAVWNAPVVAPHFVAPPIEIPPEVIPVEEPRPPVQTHPAPSHAAAHTAPPHRAAPEPDGIRNLVPPFISNLIPAINISMDSEQILIIVLMFMMYQDGSDKFLLLALAYILLI
jgi:hypothetical protein